MFETGDNTFGQKFLDQNPILQEYETIISSLKEDLSTCKLEQNKLRLEIETLYKENQNANDAIRQSLTECNHDNCIEIEHDKEAITNLEKRITILQMEKDSVTQLWQMALKAIDVLEDELKSVNKEDRSSKFYQEQINNVKESYSEAIKLLESKLTAAKESFFQQQQLWEKSKEKLVELAKEKNDVIQEITQIKNVNLEKEKKYQETINTLTGNLKHMREKFEQIKYSKITLEEKLKNAQQFSTAMIIKDNEAKSKVSEAVVLIESAVKEKEEALRREVLITEEKLKLENYIVKLTEESNSRLEKEMQKAKETYSKNIKKYLLEIKELKAALREQATLLDRSHREYRMAEEELEKVRCNAENLVQRSSGKSSNYEKNFEDKKLRFQNLENYKIPYDDKIYNLEQQVSHLQEKLLSTSEKLRRIQMQSSRDVEDQIREADDRTRDIMEKCSNFERQLTRALCDKENLASSLRTLEASFEKEMQKRNYEKILLEGKVKELQEKIINKGALESTFSINVANESPNKPQNLISLDSVSSILTLQDKFDKKTKELTQHVETHQKLSSKWKEEANLVTKKFEKRSQEQKNKISALQRQNEELSRELLFYQKLLARCNTQVVQNCSKELETR